MGELAVVFLVRLSSSLVRSCVLKMCFVFFCFGGSRFCPICFSFGLGEIITSFVLVLFR